MDCACMGTRKKLPLNPLISFAEERELESDLRAVEMAVHYDARGSAFLTTGKQQHFLRDNLK